VSHEQQDSAVTLAKHMVTAFCFKKEVKLPSSITRIIKSFKTPKTAMPTKGVQCYSWIDVPGCQIDFSVPGTTLTRNQLKTPFNDHLEVDKAKIKGPFNFTGTFSFKVSQNGKQIAFESGNINTLTGNVEAGSMKTIENQLSTVTNDIIVSYGFYDAGPGTAGLPSSNQCWVTVTSSYSGWMGSLAPSGSAQAQKPFSKLFLPAAHDIGLVKGTLYMINC
jgi:hypothetical protein